MIQQFTTKRDVMAAFSYAMNLISPEVENHHEKVAYIAGQIAKIMGLNAGQRQLVIYGALLLHSVRMRSSRRSIICSTSCRFCATAISLG